MNKLAQANAAMRRGEYSAALEMYRQVLQNSSHMTEMLAVNMEICQRKLGVENVIKKGAVPRKALPGSFEDLSSEIFVGIACITQRVKALALTIDSLIGQTDKIGVYLNGWEKVPNFLISDKIIIRGMGEPDLGDAGKFFLVETHSGYYFSCDDDLVYPPDYVEKSIEKIKEYKNQAVIGWHGSLILPNFKDYYDKNSRRVFTFSGGRPFDTRVHILGTGCTAFHTSSIKLKLSDFKAPNMADVFLAAEGQRQKVPFIVIKHDKDRIKEVENTKGSSIYVHSSSGVESKKNTRLLQNQLINDLHPWSQQLVIARRYLIIGRFESYSKGGIYKSCHLIAKTLRSLGHTVDVVDTQQTLNKDEISEYNLAWIYPGDPDRPDFGNVEKHITMLRANGVIPLVNFSYLYKSERSAWIASELKRYNFDRRLPPVMAALFTESSCFDSELDSVRDFLCVVPKTIEPTRSRDILSFSRREGICFGDASKLSNPAVVGGNVHPWVEAVHRRMPHVPLYAYKQYAGRNPPHPKLQYVPHMTSEFGNWLSSLRLFVCLNVHLTFEMVACEAQTCGTPVCYRHMPQSLSEYLSATGMAVRSPSELADVAFLLYNDPQAWAGFSRASELNGRSKSIEMLQQSLEAYLLLAETRAMAISKRKAHL
jgi:hypothetical protein